MKTVKLTFLVLSALSLFGCAAGLGGPAAENDNPRQYATVSVSANSVRILKAQAYRNDGGLLVSGRVKRMHQLPLAGHLDLVVCAPDGTPLAREKVRIPGLSSNRRGVMETSFRMNLAMVPPDGALIHLRYHPPAGNAGDFGCSHS
jgi:hypothetical protein